MGEGLEMLYSQAGLGVICPKQLWVCSTADHKTGESAVKTRARMNCHLVPLELCLLTARINSDQLPPTAP